MTSRVRARVVRRPSLPLSAQDERDLALLSSSSLHRDALVRLSGEDLDDDVSEAALLHAVFEVGLTAIREATEEAGYAQLASDQAVAAIEHRAEARRRKPSWADES